MTAPAPAPPDDRDAVRDRMDGDYEPPIDAEPVGGPIPAWEPITD